MKLFSSLVLHLEPSFKLTLVVNVVAIAPQLMRCAVYRPYAAQYACLRIW